MVCGLVVQNGRVLSAQRSSSMPLPGYWEFPGGKVEEGESDQAALVRELREELEIDVTVGERLGTIVHHYPEKSIELIAYQCTIDRGPPVLHEHADLRWCTLSQLSDIKLATADQRLVDQLILGAAFPELR